MCLENGGWRLGSGFGRLVYMFVDFLIVFGLCVGGFCVSFFLLALSCSGSSVCMIPRCGC